jgi:hypothetical protein
MTRARGFEPPTCHRGDHSTVVYPVPLDPELVGARGFEPPTSWSQTTRSTKLSYAPIVPRVIFIMKRYGSHAEKVVRDSEGS